MPNLLNPIETRLIRVDNQINELSKKISDWKTNDPPRVKCELNESRLGFKLILEEFKEPNVLQNLGLLVGECVHNLRSILDNLAFSLAKLKMDPPINPHKIFFPIYDIEELFKKKKNELGRQFSTEVINKFELIQPFHRNNPSVEGSPEIDPLILLQWISNNDKHRIPSISLLMPQEFQHSPSVEFYSDEDAALNVPPVVIHHAGFLEPGVVIMENITNRPIKSVRGNYKFQATLVIPLKKGYEPIDQILKHLRWYVGLVVNEFKQFF
ncbi:hypothetical protein [Legionella resiliens]|uniref:Uncharacterized protein n=1 Tax=Legionella resiliens TaxID=2905958 RepID=A0ABS8X2I6_9GAMM|nr:MULTISPECIES: hypothetical protein [unclassified Legionella]MCE0722803.1 hypothetical protein [Legionella sp. 9fVS26]MCE3531956.1 hypothetical protein [Legionella sp. 8cVS16]